MDIDQYIAYIQSLSGQAIPQDIGRSARGFPKEPIQQYSAHAEESS